MQQGGLSWPARFSLKQGTDDMRIRIIATGIYGADGELPIGTELDVSEEPTGWAGRYEIVTPEPAPKAQTQPKSKR